MNFQEFAAYVGLDTLLADGFFTTQLGILGLTAMLFVASLALCILAMRSAGSAKRAKREADAALETVQALAGEIQTLHSADGEAIHHSRQDRVSARETTPEAKVRFFDRKERKKSKRELKEDDRRLAEATKAATEPSALLTGFLRRR